MKKRVRKSVLMVLLAVVASLAGLGGAGLFQLRKSPDFHEWRGDALAARGDFPLAARQYAAAAVRAGEDYQKRALLLLKRAEALGRTQRESIEDVFADAFAGIEALMLAVKTAPHAAAPMACFLDLHYHLADLADTVEAWSVLENLVDKAIKESAVNKAPPRFQALLAYHRLRLVESPSPESMERCVAALGEALQQWPADPELDLCLRVARLLLASRIVDAEPGRAYSLRADALAPAAGGAAADADLYQANTLVAKVYGHLYESGARTDSGADLARQWRRQADALPTPRAKLRLARELLRLPGTVDRDGQSSAGETATATAMDMVQGLSRDAEVGTVARYLLLLRNEADGNVDGIRSVFEEWRDDFSPGEGLFARSLAWRLQVARCRFFIEDRFETMLVETDAHEFERKFSEAKDKLAILGELQKIHPAPDDYKQFFEALLHRLNLERRRALANLLEFHQAAAEEFVPQVKAEIGSLLLELGEHGAAIPWLSEAVAKSDRLSVSTQVRAFDELCQAYVGSMRIEEAVRLAGGLSAANADHASLLLAGGRALRRASQIADGGPPAAENLLTAGAALLEKASAENPRDCRPLFELGLVRIQQGNIGGAAELLRACLDIEPAHRGALRALTLLASRGASSRREVADLVASAAKRGLDPRVATRIQELCQEGARTGQTEKILAGINLLQPSRLGQLFALRQNLRDSGETDRARQLLDELAVAFPDHELVVAARFRDLVDSGDFAAAEKIIDPVGHPQVVRSLLHRLGGELLLTLRQPYGAIDHLRRALRSDPYNSAGHILLGRAQEMTRLGKEAAGSFREAARICPANTAIWLDLHRSLDALGQRGEAAEILRWLAARSRGGREAVNLYLEYEAAIGQPESVIPMRLQLAGARPEDEANLRRLADLLLGAGDREDAGRILGKLLSEGRERTANQIAMAGMLGRTEGAGAAVEYLADTVPAASLSAAPDEALAVARFMFDSGAGTRAGPYLEIALQMAAGERVRQAAGTEYVKWLLGENRKAEALDQARGLLRRSSSIALRVELGQQFLKEGETAAVVDVLADGPQAVETLALAAKAKAQMGRIEDAEKDLEKAMQLDPLDPRPFIWRAAMLVQAAKGRPSRKAEMDLHKAIALQPTMPECHVMLAEMLERDGRVEDAEKIVVGLVQGWPEDARYRLWRGDLAVKRGDLETAKATIAEAAKRGVDGSGWYLLGARILQREGKSRQALATLLPGLGDSMSPDVAAFAVELLLDLGMAAEVDALLRHDPSAPPDSALFLARAVVAARTGDENACQTHLRKAVETLPAWKDPRIWTRFSRVLTPPRLGKLAGEMMKEPEPRLPELVFLGSYADYTGADAEAVAIARHVLPLLENGSPNQLAVGTLLAENLRRSGQPGRAARVYSDLLAAFPEARHIGNNLAYLYAAELGQPEIAETLVLKALTGQPLSDTLRGAFLDTLGLAQFAQGKLTEAEETFGDAFRLSGSWEILAHQGRLDLKKGDGIAGRRKLERALQGALAAGRSAYEVEGVMEIMAAAGEEVPREARAEVVLMHAKEGRPWRYAKLIDTIQAERKLGPDLLLSLAEIELRQGRLLAAREKLELAMAAASLDAAHALRIIAVSGRIFPDLAMAAHRIVLESGGIEDRREAARWLTANGYYEEARAVCRKNFADTRAPDDLIGLLVAAMGQGNCRVADDWPPAAECPDLEDSAGALFVLAAARRDYTEVLERARYVNVDPRIDAESVALVGLFLAQAGRSVPQTILDAIDDKARQMAPGSPAVLRFSMRNNMRAGRYDKAQNEAVEILRGEATAQDVIGDLGEVYVRSGDSGKLASLIGTYKIFYGETGWCHSLLGELARLRGERAAAIAAFARSLELAPARRSAMRLLEELIAGKDLERARQVVDRHAELLGSYLVPALRSRLAFLAGEAERAADECLTALRLLESGDDVTREQVLQQLVAACPPAKIEYVVAGGRTGGVSDAALADFLGTALEGSAEAHVDALERLYRQAPAGSQVRRRSGLLLANVASSKEGGGNGMQLHRRLAEEFPASAEVLDALARFLYRHGGDPAEANVYAARAVELADEGKDNVLLSQCLETLGLIQQAFGLATPARHSFSRSVNLDRRAENSLLLAKVLFAERAWLGAEGELDRVEKLAAREQRDDLVREAKLLRTRINERRGEAVKE